MPVPTRPSDTAVHYHRDDYPSTLRLIGDVMHESRTEERLGGPGRDIPGIERSDSGLFIDWDQVEDSWLSTTEKAVMHIARGLAILERHGGAGPLSDVVADTVSRVA